MVLLFHCFLFDGFLSILFVDKLRIQVNESSNPYKQSEHKRIEKENKVLNILKPLLCLFKGIKTIFMTKFLLFRDARIENFYRKKIYPDYLLNSKFQRGAVD